MLRLKQVVNAGSTGARRCIVLSINDLSDVLDDRLVTPEAIATLMEKGAARLVLTPQLVDR